MEHVRPAPRKLFERKCRDATQAKSLADEVIRRTLSAHVSTTPERSSAQVFRVAVSTWFRRARRLPGHGAVFDVARANAPDRKQEASRSVRDVVRALSELNERTRDVLILVCLEQMTQAAVSEIFAISTSTVTWHLAKALAHMGRWQGRQGRSR